MKKKLQHYSRRKLRFVATIDKLGWRNTPSRSKRIRTIMLKDVTVEKTGEDVADHAWVDCGKWSLELKPRDKFSFEAKVQRYEKGYKGVVHNDDDIPIQDDYRFVNPTKVKIFRKGKSS